MSDVILIGGGVIGSAIAYFLAKDPDFNGRITVFERDPSYEFSTSARSVASIRQQFSTPENIAISSFGYDFLTAIDTHLSVAGEVPDIQFHEGRYLFLGAEESRNAFDRTLALQHACGAEVERIEGPAALSERFSWLNAEDLAFAHLGLSREGWFDGYALTRAFRKKAIDLGVVYRDEEIVGLERQGARITAAVTAKGERVSGGSFVNSAGGRARWCHVVERLQGHQRRRRRQRRRRGRGPRRL